ncbi:GtrA family protein [Andreprevotia chitinilytica]|uniref:GtrA family protein n=1 Tax=Andreprevotia chitinilytica TaxID=396808 RepID=UPI001B80ADB8|nr:GtrA family protein [Andreprevotia chitinilytica]
MKRVLQHPMSKQFIQFAAVGLVGTGVQYLTILLGTDWLGFAAAVTSALGYVLGAFANYVLNYFFTFKSGKSHSEAAAKYFTIVGIGWCLNTGLMTLFVNHLGWNHWVAQVITTGIGLIWNFGGSRFWAFREHHHG